MDVSEPLSPDSTSTAQGSISSPNPVVSRIDGELYKAAVEGNFQPFIDVENMESLLTPTKNTILHIHITSSSTPKKVYPTSCVGHFLHKCRDLMYQTVPENVVSQEFVEQILDRCGDLLLLSNSKKETPLHIAARYGHSEITQLLIARAKALPPHQDIENGSIGVEKEFMRATNSEGNTALHEAVRYHHIEVVKILLQMDPDYSYGPNNANETLLFLASERKYEDIMMEILEKVESPAYDGPNGCTALHVAVINGQLEMAKALVAKEHVRGAVKQADKEGWVPLHYAAKMGDKELTQMLLKEDENTAYMRDSNGRTALHIAAYCGNVFIMDLIMEYCPDCSEIVDNKGWNALHYAINGNNWPAVEKIMSKPSLSNIYNDKDQDGNTPLHHSMFVNLATSRPLRLLQHNRVDKLAVNKKDQTPLDVAYQALKDSSYQWLARVRIYVLKAFGALQRQGLKELKRKDEEEKESLTTEFTKEAKESHLFMCTKEAKESHLFMFTKEAKEKHMLTAILIATVSFAAGITLPGGTIQDGDGNGSPILGQRTSFKAFIVFNTLALVLAASAAFMHLFSPLTKAKWKDQFLSGVAFTFTSVAIVAMILAFATATYAVLGSSSIGIAVITITLSFLLFCRIALKTYSGYSPLILFLYALYYIIYLLTSFGPIPIPKNRQIKKKNETC